MKTFAIDQSLRSTGLCLLDDSHDGPLPPVLESVQSDGETLIGFERVQAIHDRIAWVLEHHAPDLVVMEDYAYGASSSSSSVQCEIGGIVKLLLHRRGYRFGWGTGHNKAEREHARQNTLAGTPLFVVQTVGGMKKFNLGGGNVTKDERYLLTVQEKTGLAFQDSDQADAWMHANMASITYGLIRGEISFATITRPQVESLIARGVKAASKMSMAKAMKLPDEEKVKLIGW